MIITRTLDTHGRCRVYIGPKSSVECWIEPTDGGWKVDAVDAFGGSPLTDQEKRHCVVHLLLQLADELRVHPDDLHPDVVSFEAIEALHAGSPLDYRRVATPRKRSVEHGFMATAPGITRPSGDFRSDDRQQQRRNR